MNSNNQIRLRLRFYKDVNQNIDSLRQKFIHFTIASSPDFILKIKHYNIWINMKGMKKAYWSPHLHLEMEPKDDGQTHIRGLYGPDPDLWTLFLYLNYIMAGVFIIFCGITFTDYVLQTSTKVDFIIMSVVAFSWSLLYIVARQIRRNGKKQIHDIEKVLLEIIDSPV